MGREEEKGQDKQLAPGTEVAAHATEDSTKLVQDSLDISEDRDCRQRLLLLEERYSSCV